METPSSLESSDFTEQVHFSLMPGGGALGSPGNGLYTSGAMSRSNQEGSHFLSLLCGMSVPECSKWYLFITLHIFMRLVELLSTFYRWKNWGTESKGNPKICILQDLPMGPWAAHFTSLGLCLSISQRELQCYAILSTERKCLNILDTYFLFQKTTLAQF
jgi:hypothetical protein